MVSPAVDSPQCSQKEKIRLSPAAKGVQTSVSFSGAFPLPLPNARAFRLSSLNQLPLTIGVERDERDMGHDDDDDELMIYD